MLEQRRFNKVQKDQDPKFKDISLHGKGKGVDLQNQNSSRKKNFGHTLRSKDFGGTSRFAAISPDDEEETALDDAENTHDMNNVPSMDNTRSPALSLLKERRPNVQVQAQPNLPTQQINICVQVTRNSQTQAKDNIPQGREENLE